MDHHNRSELVNNTGGPLQYMRLGVDHPVLFGIMLVFLIVMSASLYASIRALDRSADEPKDIANARIELMSQVYKAQVEASTARANSENAQREATRAQAQADLANWTMNNLEGLMKEKGFTIPKELQPKNLGPNWKGRRK
jgi:hypothetical protein